MCIALDTLWLVYFGHCPEAKLIHSVESTDLTEIQELDTVEHIKQLKCVFKTLSTTVTTPKYRLRQKKFLPHTL